MSEVEQQLRLYLEKNGFYAYESQREHISSNFEKEFEAVALPENKRNLFLQKKWSEIHSLGEPRDIIVADLGGTNLNLFSVRVNGNITVKNTVATSFYEDERVYTPEVLFDELRKHLDVLVKPEEREAAKNLVFIFSYPIEQLTRDDGYVDAICTYFGKMRKTEGIVGLQVGQAFQEYLRQHEYPNIHVSVTNDTPVYCLAGKAYEILHDKKYDAGMNIIVGTGTNISVAFDMPDREGTLEVVNTEFGDFTGVILSRFDEIFDKECGTPGRYLTEKMVSGAWLYQVFAVILRDLLEHGVVGKALFEKFPFDGLSGETVEDMVHSDRLPADQQEIVQFLWTELNRRGGAICGILFARMMQNVAGKLGSQPVHFGCVEVGSVIRKGTGFRDSFLEVLESELTRLGSKDRVSYDMIHFEHQAPYGGVVFDSFFNV